MNLFFYDTFMLSAVPAVECTRGVFIDTCTCIRAHVYTCICVCSGLPRAPVHVVEHGRQQQEMHFRVRFGAGLICAKWTMKAIARSTCGFRYEGHIPTHCNYRYAHSKRLCTWFRDVVEALMLIFWDSVIGIQDEGKSACVFAKDGRFPLHGRRT